MMTAAGRLTGIVLAALALVQCDKVESVTFPFKAGMLDDNTSPEVFEAAVDCVPSDTVMPYPLFTRLGLTQIAEKPEDAQIGPIEQPEGTLFARGDNSRRYIFDGERWQPIYQIIGRRGTAWEINEWNEVAADELPDLTWDFWYPPNTEQFVRMTNERIWRGELYSEEMDRVRETWEDAWQPQGDPPEEISPNDFLWNSTVQYSIFPTGENSWRGYQWRDSAREIPADTRVANWWSAVFGASKYDWVTVGGEANGPGAVTRNLAEAVAAADSVKGRITRYSYFRDEDGIDDWEAVDFDAPPAVPLADVFGSSAFDFWTVGNRMSKQCPRVVGEVFRCNDTRCALSARVPGAFLKSIHGRSGADFYVVGGNDEQNAGAVILHYRKGKWRRIDAPADIPLNRIWVSPWDAIYAVGGAYSPEGTPSSVALLFEEGEWKILDLGAEMPLYDVYGRSADDVYFVGEEGVFHYPDAREYELADIALNDTCHLYCLRLMAESPSDNDSPLWTWLPEDVQEEALWVEECVPNCEVWLSESLSVSPACHHGISVLMQCINQSSYADAAAFLSDPTAEESACAAEYAHVHCDGFTLRTDMADPEG